MGSFRFEPSGSKSIYSFIAPIVFQFNSHIQDILQQAVRTRYFVVGTAVEVGTAVAEVGTVAVADIVETEGGIAPVVGIVVVGEGEQEPGCTAAVAGVGCRDPIGVEGLAGNFGSTNHDHYDVVRYHHCFVLPIAVAPRELVGFLREQALTERD